MFIKRIKANTKAFQVFGQQLDNTDKKPSGTGSRQGQVDDSKDGQYKKTKPGEEKETTLGYKKNGKDVIACTHSTKSKKSNTTFVTVRLAQRRTERNTF